MKAYNNFDRKEAYTEKKRLPVGGYVLKILDAQETAPYQDGCTRLVVSFDVAEGEQKDFYRDQYASQTGEDKKWKGTYRISVPCDDGSDQDTRRRRNFTSFIVAVEDSNAGYHWDWNEKGLKGKLFGGVFNNKEWEMNGRTGFFTNLARITTAEKIRNHDFEIPADTLLVEKPKVEVPENVFMAINEDDGLPFV